ncbi:MAG: TetR/AcrR family transcriptional regulator C-terminal domain-containing protein [Spirochaetales bacterium]|nr:TetR/AcrR family transcriptional regulator C-terminal domain-containing protein [Candidatus Physcosoma equi]
MAQTTKYLLFESFRNLLKDRPLSKITITDITDGVGVNRHTFYYHFKDLNGLLSWGFDSTLERMLNLTSAGEDFAAGLKSLLEYAVSEKKFILTIYHSDLREHLERLIKDWTYRLVKDIVSTSARDIKLRESDVDFIINFFKFGIGGLLVDWLDGGMMEPAEKISGHISTLVSGDFKDILEKFRQDK